MNVCEYAILLPTSAGESGSFRGEDSLFMPLIIGMAGSIATHKSNESSLLVCLGAFHCKAGQLIHHLYDSGPLECHHRVSIFRRGIISTDGKVEGI
jgi:dephospho-CoA kinase